VSITTELKRIYGISDYSHVYRIITGVTITTELRRINGISDYSQAYRIISGVTITTELKLIHHSINNTAEVCLK
jgi:hypothetical protein